jgi:uncharacterized protein YfaS (alpha-2-macroglobulin family)
MSPISSPAPAERICGAGRGVRPRVENLKNRLAYAGDFESGGEAIAYALYVLASNGRASIGDLRYYAETKLEAFRHPACQGAGRRRSGALWRQGPRRDGLPARPSRSGHAPRRWASRWQDYGSNLRDGAAMLTLASETRTGIDLVSLSRRIEQERQNSPHTSTQEDAWSLMAAHALIESSSQPQLVADGEPVNGPLFRGLEAEALALDPLDLENRGERAVEVGVTVRGVPRQPEPAGGNYYALTRSYHTLDGEPVVPSAVEQGQRLVAVLAVTTTESQGARLILDDPLPAGFEIDNPHVLRSGDVARSTGSTSSSSRRTWNSAPTASSRPGTSAGRRHRVPVRLHRAGRVARQLRPSGGAGGGHVSPRTPRPHRTGRIEVAGPLR